MLVTAVILAELATCHKQGSKGIDHIHRVVALVTLFRFFEYSYVVHMPRPIVVIVQGIGRKGILAPPHQSGSISPLPPLPHFFISRKQTRPSREAISR